MNQASPGTQGTLESFVSLVDVLTDPTVVVLVLVIVFRKQIAPHIARIAQELARLLSRVQSARVGTTRFDFSPTDLRTMAMDNNPELLRQILLQLPEAPAPEQEEESETEQQIEDESAELAARLHKLKQFGQEGSAT